MNQKNVTQISQYYDHHQYLSCDKEKDKKF